MRQRGQAEFAVGKAFQFHIGRMLVDARFVRARAAAHGQGRRMLVRRGGQLVHHAAGQAPQPFQMRQQMRVQRGGQVALAHGGGIGVRAEQIQAARIRNGRSGGGGNGAGGGVHGGILQKTGKMADVARVH
ncbi:hypothetical protein D3C85_1038720 [compost metagenome]